MAAAVSSNAAFVGLAANERLALRAGGGRDRGVSPLSLMIFCGAPDCLQRIRTPPFQTTRRLGVWACGRA
jgi:hypothetical protein